MEILIEKVDFEPGHGRTGAGQEEATQVKYPTHAKAWRNEREHIIQKLQVLVEHTMREEEWWPMRSER